MSYRDTHHDKLSKRLAKKHRDWKPKTSRQRRIDYKKHKDDSAETYRGTGR